MDSEQYNNMLKYAHPFTGYNFCLILDGLPIGFSKISGLTVRGENYSVYHQGGDNRHVEVRMGHKSELNTLVLEKGVGSFNPSKILPAVNVMMLLVYDEQRKPIHVYGFSTGYVKKVTVSDFDAAQSKVLIDKTEIQYDFAVEIDLSGRTNAAAFAKMVVANKTLEAEAESSANASIAKIAAHNASVKAEKAKKKQAESKAAETASGDEIEE